MTTKQTRIGERALLFRTLRGATRLAERLTEREPYRSFAVVQHPRHPKCYAVGVFAAGVLLFGYVEAPR